MTSASRLGVVGCGRIRPVLHFPLLRGLGPVRPVRAFDTLGLRSVPSDVNTVVLATDGSAGRATDRHAFADRLAAAVGSDDPHRTNLYWLMLMLGVHDLAVLRAILGA